MEEIILKEQNPWWMNKDRILEDQKVREALSRKHKLLYTFKEKSNILFFGPRQTGKTTFFKLLIYDLLKKGVDPRKIVYFSCEILRNFEEIVDVIRKIDVLVEGRKYVFLDEVSFVENWERAVKYILDSPLAKDKIIYLTGSSSIALRKESFPGRPIKIREFLPLTFKSFVRVFGSEELKKSLSEVRFKSLEEVFKKAKKLFYYQEELDRLFYKYLECGGFPRAFYELMEEKRIKEETYDIYWKWLIHDLSKINKSERIATGVLIGVLKNYGSKFSLSSIAKEVEIGSHVTVREYLEVLEALFCIRNFFTFDLNKKRIVYRKMRKAYFIDPFLYHVFSKRLLGKSIERYETLVEGIVGEALARKFRNVGFFHNRKEIDFCFRNFGIEVKWKEDVTPKDFPRVGVKNKVIVSKKTFEFHKNLLIIPASLLLTLL